MTIDGIKIRELDLTTVVDNSDVFILDHMTGADVSVSTTQQISWLHLKDNFASGDITFTGNVEFNNPVTIKGGLIVEGPITGTVELRLEELSNVTVSQPETGHVIAWNGFGWANVPQSGGGTDGGGGSLPTELTHLPFQGDQEVVTLKVTVGLKTLGHRYPVGAKDMAGNTVQGNGKTYFIDGEEAPHIVLNPGRTYKFDLSDPSNTGYPMRLYSSAEVPFLGFIANPIQEPGHVRYVGAGSEGNGIPNTSYIELVVPHYPETGVTPYPIYHYQSTTTSTEAVLMGNTLANIEGTTPFYNPYVDILNNNPNPFGNVSPADRAQLEQDALAISNQQEFDDFVAKLEQESGEYVNTELAGKANLVNGEVPLTELPDVLELDANGNIKPEFLPPGYDKPAEIEVIPDVITVGPENDASVEDKAPSDPHKAILQFTIPRGEKGEDGTSVKIAGSIKTKTDLVGDEFSQNGNNFPQNEGDVYVVETGDPLDPEQGDCYVRTDKVPGADINDTNVDEAFNYLGKLQGPQGPAGVDGTDGEDGEDGLSAIVEAGDTFPLAPGSDPSVTPTYPSATPEDPALHHVKFDFFIPKGDKGDDGAVGTAATVDVDPDPVTLAPGNYVEVENTGDTTNAVFKFKIPVGDIGPQGVRGLRGPIGPIGPQGEQGEEGEAASIVVQSTNTLPPGTPAFVENFGPPNAARLDFYIPQGEKGVEGDDGESAYDIYVRLEKEGGNLSPLPENEWLESLNGEDGTGLDTSFSAVDNSSLPNTLTLQYNKDIDNGGPTDSVIIKGKNGIKVLQEGLNLYSIDGNDLNDPVIFLGGIRAESDDGLIDADLPQLLFNDKFPGESPANGSYFIFINNGTSWDGNTVQQGDWAIFDSIKWVVLNYQLDSTSFVYKTGDTMTGDLTMDGATVTGLPLPLQSAQAANKLYVDTREDAIRLDLGDDIGQVQDNLDDRFNELSGQQGDYLPLVGGTLTGSLAIDTGNTAEALSVLDADGSAAFEVFPSGATEAFELKLTGLTSGANIIDVNRGAFYTFLDSTQTSKITYGGQFIITSSNDLDPTDLVLSIDTNTFNISKDGKVTAGTKTTPFVATDRHHVATKAFIEDRFVKLSGENILGSSWKLKGPNTDDSGTYTFHTITGGEQKLYHVHTPVIEDSDPNGKDQWVANVGFVKSQVGAYLPLVGGELSGPLVIKSDSGIGTSVLDIRDPSTDDLRFGVNKEGMISCHSILRMYGDTGAAIQVINSPTNNNGTTFSVAKSGRVDINVRNRTSADSLMLNMVGADGKFAFQVASDGTLTAGDSESDPFIASKDHHLVTKKYADSVTDDLPFLHTAGSDQSKYPMQGDIKFEKYSAPQGFFSLTSLKPRLYNGTGEFGLQIDISDENTQKNKFKVKTYTGDALVVGSSDSTGFVDVNGKLNSQSISITSALDPASTGTLFDVKALGAPPNVSVFFNVNNDGSVSAGYDPLDPSNDVAFVATENYHVVTLKCLNDKNYATKTYVDSNFIKLTGTNDTTGTLTIKGDNDKGGRNTYIKINDGNSGKLNLYHVVTPSDDKTEWAANVQYVQNKVSGLATEDYVDNAIDSMELSGALIYKGVVATNGDLPNDPSVGDFYHVTGHPGYFAWNGSEWQEVGSAAEVDLDGYLETAGGTMTGILTLDNPGNQRVNFTSNTYSANCDIARNGTWYVSFQADRVKLGIQLDVNNKKLINVPTPSNSKDAANKEYVDGKIGSYVKTPDADSGADTPIEIYRTGSTYYIKGGAS